MSTERIHIPAIDSLRGIAATLVCFYHFVYTTIDYVHGDVVREFSHLGYYGVHMFFVISGVVIPLSMIMGAYTHKSWLRFIARRFVRIEPPYLASIVVALIYLTVRNYIPGTAAVDLRPDLSTILLHIGYFIPFSEGSQWINNVYWSLAVEFQYYLLLCLVFPLFIQKKAWLRIVLYGLFLSAGFLLGKSSFLPVWLPLFLMGISYVLYRYKYIKPLELMLVEIGSFAMTIYFIDYKAGLMGAITLAIIHFLPNLRNGLSKFIGDISYSLYLLHTIVGSAIINYLSHTYRLPWQKVMVISLGYIASVAAAYLMFKWIEKPSQRWARKIKY